MRGRVKQRVNQAYEVMEANVVTSILVSGGTSALLAIGLTAALGLYSSATYVQKTACYKDPASRECAEIRQSVARAEPIKNPCISVQRVTGEKGRNCSRFFVPHGRELQAKSKSIQNLEQGSDGGEAPSSAHGGISPAPVHHGSTKTPATHAPVGHSPHESPAENGGDEGGSAPEQGTPQGSEGSASSEVPPGEQSAPEPRQPPSVLEAVGGVVNSTGHVVEAAGCGLASPLLCPKP